MEHERMVDVLVAIRRHETSPHAGYLGIHQVTLAEVDEVIKAGYVTPKGKLTLRGWAIISERETR